MRRVDWTSMIGALIAFAFCTMSYACAKSPPQAAPAPSTKPPDKPSPFPSREELSRLGQSPPTQDLLDLPMRDVDSWQLEGVLPQRIRFAPYQAASPWEEVLAQGARRSGGTLYPSTAMHCVAREYARFYVAHNVRPTVRLLQYMAGACGAIAQDLATRVLYATVPEGISDDDLFRNWKEGVDRLLLVSAQGTPRVAGLAFARDKDRAVVVVVRGERRVELKPLAPVPDVYGRVLIEGRLLVPAERIHALINRGHYGFAECAADPRISLPRFAILCQMAKSDDLSWIQISFLPPGRILSKSALHLLARVRGARIDIYQRHLYANSVQAATPEQFTARLTKALNEVRQRAQLPPLALATRQSEVAAKVAPRFFAAALGKVDPLDADRIALGMMAGWEVEGIIRQGSFSSTLIGETRDVSRWLSTALEFPGGRQTLLSRDAAKLAVGPLLVEQNQLLGAIVGSYSFFGESQEADENKIFSLITRHRADLGLSAPKRLDALDPQMRDAGGKIRSGTASPINVLNELLKASARTLHRSVNGFVLDSSRLADFRLPEEFMQRRSLEVAIKVTYYRPPGAPWGRYVFLVIVPSPLPSA